MTESFWQNINFFKKSEFEDDQGDCWIDQDLVAMLDTARHHANTPFKINSACRNPAQNKRVGGSENSAHLSGLAVDISAVTSGQRFNIVNGAIKAGFTRIGVSNSFVHLDNDQKKSQKVLWVYPSPK